MRFLVTDSSRRRVDWKAERERIDLAAVATRLLGPAPGRRGEGGRKLWWRCPFHEDRNPSFAVDPGKPWWKCYGCGERGDAATLVMKLDGKSFPEAVAELTGGPTAPRKARAGVAKRPSAKPPPQPSGMPEWDALALVEAAAALLWTPEGASALAYLTGPDRRLSPEMIRAARLGYTPKADGVPWKPPGIVIPWFLDGRLALVKVRPPGSWRMGFRAEKRPPKYLEGFREPSRLVCYPGPDVVRPGRPLVVVEGEFDALALGEALGGMAAVVTLGSASSGPAEVFGRFLAASPWYVATDADPAGDKAADGWPGRARRVRPPEPFKDWCEAGVAGVDLARWWRDLMAGDPRPALFTWPELARQRWGPAVDDPTPGIIIERPGSDRSALGPCEVVAPDVFTTSTAHLRPEPPACDTSPGG